MWISSGKSSGKFRLGWMDFEESIKFAEEIVSTKTGKPLNNAQSAVLKGAWNYKKYGDIAESFQCSPEYLMRDVGPKLWKVLSEQLGQKVGIKNFRTVMERRSPNPDSVSSQQVSEPTASNGDRLYNALLRLNYSHQVSLFRQLVGTYPVGTCLVHGDTEYGQRWLVNRLVQLVPNGMTAKVVSFGLTRKSRANYINALWRELGGRVGLTGQPEPGEIAEAVCQWWETQNVILIFHNVDRMPKEYIDRFRRDFWLPLSEKANPSPQTSHKLLLFLVDHSGEVEGWDVAFAEVLDDWQPQIPLKLPRIERLGDRDLVSWIENSINELPVEFATDGDRLVREILENSDNGVPQLVLEYICSLCNCNWYEQERIWLKH